MKPLPDEDRFAIANKIHGPGLSCRCMGLASRCGDPEKRITLLEAINERLRDELEKSDAISAGRLKVLSEKADALRIERQRADNLDAENARLRGEMRCVDCPCWMYGTFRQAPCPIHDGKDRFPVGSYIKYLRWAKKHNPELLVT